MSKKKQQEWNKTGARKAKKENNNNTPGAVGERRGKLRFLINLPRLLFRISLHTFGRSSDNSRIIVATAAAYLRVFA